MINPSTLPERSQHGVDSALAGIDCGTNSIRLLISDETGSELYRTSRIIRLGTGVDAQGKISAEALDRLRLALEEFTEKMHKYHVSTISMIATSAVRDARNKADFFHICASILSSVDSRAYAKLLSGDEEAHLTFLGVTHPRSGLNTVIFPALVTDLGGGSTEFAVGNNQQLQAAYSMDMGCVRITEKFLFSDPPTESEIRAAMAFIDELINTAVLAIDLDRKYDLHSWIGVAGTFTTLGAVTLGLKKYDSQRIHGAQIPLSELDLHAREVLHMSQEQRANIGVIAKGRIDVIGAGALIVHRLIHWIENHSTITSITLSERDILDGIIYSLLEQK